MVTVLFLASGLFIFFLGMRIQSQLDDKRITDIINSSIRLQKNYEETRNSIEVSSRLLQEETNQIKTMRETLDKIISQTQR